MDHSHWQAFGVFANYRSSSMARVPLYSCIIRFVSTLKCKPKHKFLQYFILESKIFLKQVNININLKMLNVG